VVAVNSVPQVRSTSDIMTGQFLSVEGWVHVGGPDTSARSNGVGIDASEEV
jgi:hypothetical protein